MNSIDLFCGVGGFSEGARRAGVGVLMAADIWFKAVCYHSHNHAGTEHRCCDLLDMDWRSVPKHDILLASPPRQGHSLARGKDKPHHSDCRDAADVVVKAAEACRPKALIIENVEQIRKWGRFGAWLQAFRDLGYGVSEHLIDAADCGVPQNRKRLFVVGLLGRCPLGQVQPSVPHVPASYIVDFSRGTWSPVNKPGRAEATLRRVASARARYGSRFLMPYYTQGSGITGRELDRPLGTVTTISRWALVDGDRMRMLTVEELRAAMGFPAYYSLPSFKRDAERMLGNAVCPPVAEFLIRRVVEAIA